MSHKISKKQLLLIVLLVLIVALISLFVIYRNKNKKSTEPTYEQKVEVIKKLNEDALKAPQLTTEKKEEIIEDMNKTTGTVTVDEKKALLEKYNR